MITTVLIVLSVISLIACIVLSVYASQSPSKDVVPSGQAGAGTADPKRYQTPAIVTGVVGGVLAIGAAATSMMNS